MLRERTTASKFCGVERLGRWIEVLFGIWVRRLLCITVTGILWKLPGRPTFRSQAKLKGERLNDRGSFQVVSPPGQLSRGCTQCWCLYLWERAFRSKRSCRCKLLPELTACSSPGFSRAYRGSAQLRKCSELAAARSIPGMGWTADPHSVICSVAPLGPSNHHVVWLCMICSRWRCRPTAAAAVS